MENHDDAAYFNRAKGILLPLMVKKQSTNVDAVSGATFSSNGIIKAVRNALSKAAVNKSSSDSSSTSTTKDTTKKDTTEKVSGTYKDGVYEGTGTGFRGKITVSVRIKKSKIVEIKLVKNEKMMRHILNVHGPKFHLVLLQCRVQIQIKLMQLVVLHIVQKVSWQQSEMR